jgi:hypothetical protein
MHVDDDINITDLTISVWWIVHDARRVTSAARLVEELAGSLVEMSPVNGAAEAILQ